MDTVFFFGVDGFLSVTASLLSLAGGSRCAFLFALGLSLSLVLLAAALGLIPALGLTDALGFTAFFEVDLPSLVLVAEEAFCECLGSTIVSAVFCSLRL